MVEIWGQCPHLPDLNLQNWQGNIDANDEEM